MSYLFLFLGRLNHARKGQGLLGHLKSQKFGFLIIELSLFYIGLALVFAFLYWHFNLVEHAKAGNFIDYFYFSFITQSTIGYGDLSPIGLGRLLVIIQGMLGILLFAIGTGLIIYKVSLPTDDEIVFDEFLLYNPTKGKFTFRIVNWLAFPLYSVEVDMQLRYIRMTQRGEAKIIGKKIMLFRDKITILPSLRPFLISTKPIDEFKGASSLKIDQGLTLEPSHVSSSSKITITLKPQYFRGTSVITKTYKSDQIKCGFFLNIFNSDGTADWKNWGAYRRVIEEQCTPCVYHKICKLR